MISLQEVYRWDKERFDFGLEKIYEQMQLIVQSEISQDEFDKAVWYLSGSLQMGIETSDALADFVGGQYLLYGEIQSLEEKLAAYKKVTLADLDTVKQKLAKENLYAYWIQ